MQLSSHDDAGMYGAIAGGCAGDARDDQTVDEGVSSNYYYRCSERSYY